MNDEKSVTKHKYLKEGFIYSLPIYFITRFFMFLDYAFMEMFGGMEGLEDAQYIFLYIFYPWTYLFTSLMALIFGNESNFLLCFLPLIQFGCYGYLLDKLQHKFRFSYLIWFILILHIIGVAICFLIQPTIL